MEKNKILSKLNINIKDYNNELEKILENKLFSYDVKNLLLSMLYKIENAYKDYETVKVEVPTKKEYIENLLGIIKEKCLKIFLVKNGTEEAKDLEKENLLYKIDKYNGEIICFGNELVLLNAIFKLNEVETEYKTPYEYVEKPLNRLINIGSINSDVEVIRDFNGWSWDIVQKEISDIEYNYIYQTLILLNGRKKAYNSKYKNIFDLICKMAVKKYISDRVDEEYINKINQLKKEKQDRLTLFQDKKSFIDTVTEEKKQCIKQIDKIDKILNNNELLKKEYYSRNEKLPNKEKIFSVSYLVEILDKERADLIEKIDECNKIILPKEFIDQKAKLEEETSFLNNIEEKISKADIIELFREFIHLMQDQISMITEENKLELVKCIYKVRYFRYIPINEEEYVKDIEELKAEFKNLISVIIKKAQMLKIWDKISDDKILTYIILKEVFDTKIICLENINIQCRYEGNILYVEYYDDTVIESAIKLQVDDLKIKKKIKLFI